MMAIHSCPSNNILLPMMHMSLAQISCCWVAKTIITRTFGSHPFISLCHSTGTIHFSSLNMEARPSNIAPLNPIYNDGEIDILNTEVDSTKLSQEILSMLPLHQKNDASLDAQGDPDSEAISVQFILVPR
jgi:hypothetical protein